MTTPRVEWKEKQTIFYHFSWTRGQKNWEHIDEQMAGTVAKDVELNFYARVQYRDSARWLLWTSVRRHNLFAKDPVFRKDMRLLKSQSSRLRF